MRLVTHVLSLHRREKTDLNPKPQVIISRTKPAAQNVQARMPLSAGGSSCAFTSLSTGSAFATFNVDEEKSGGGIVLDLSPNVVVSISMSAMVFPALLSDRRCGLMLFVPDVQVQDEKRE